MLAAGGITTGRTLAAILAAGAEGASLGTALLATPEAVEVPDAYKERILLSDGQDTAFTRLYDLLGNTPWPDGIAGRVYRNRLVREWDGRDAEIMEHREELASDVAAAQGSSRSGAFVRLHGAGGRSGERHSPRCRSGRRHLPGGGADIAEFEGLIDPIVPPGSACGHSKQSRGGV